MRVLTSSSSDADRGNRSSGPRLVLVRGVRNVVALHDAHKPGLARALNAYVAQAAGEEPRVLGLATVLRRAP